MLRNCHLSDIQIPQYILCFSVLNMVVPQWQKNQRKNHWTLCTTDQAKWSSHLLVCDQASTFVWTTVFLRKVACDSFFKSYTHVSRSLTRTDCAVVLVGPWRTIVLEHVVTSVTSISASLNCRKFRSLRDQWEWTRFSSWMNSVF